MSASEHTEVQADRTLPADVVVELERFVQTIGGSEGSWTVEAVFSNGHFVKGYVKHGPINREEMRELGQLARADQQLCEQRDDPEHRESS